MGPQTPLPCSPEFESPEQYIDSLLHFIGTSELLQNLCGGVHVLDFFTRDPDLYTVLIAPEWRSFFQAHDVMDILDLLMREDLQTFHHESDKHTWRNGPIPPVSLLQYIKQIRRLSLNRKHTPIPKRHQDTLSLARQVAVGMNVKKIHEVDHFCRYLDKLTSDIAESRKDQEITHLVDFGAGQNYLGRALASEPYNKHIIALESRKDNIQGALGWDVIAKLAPKQQIMRNKKEWKIQKHAQEQQQTNLKVLQQTDTALANLKISNSGVGSIQYIEHYIKDGNLSPVVSQIVDQHLLRDNLKTFVQGNLPLTSNIKAKHPNLLVISLHSCGNLVHHGIRSLLVNPSVKAVALIGCCYNLVTERLGPQTYKLPSLRTRHPRLEETSSSHDPHGFPMSDRFCNQQTNAGKGICFNITARMMAVQAPQNWGKADSAGFFKRHFYRALLQKIFVDRRVMGAPTRVQQQQQQSERDCHHVTAEKQQAGTAETTPIILGSLPKSCYQNFVAYVRGATSKLTSTAEQERASFFQSKLANLTDAEILDYEARYKARGHELAVMWSLMAFSAGVIEAAVVVDRYVFLKEQQQVAEAWVEAVFEHQYSPRNLVVVGIKK
jgi:hypothetical protein